MGPPGSGGTWQWSSTEYQVTGITYVRSGNMLTAANALAYKEDNPERPMSPGRYFALHSLN